MPKTLKTNLSVWTKVFRRIVQQMETDAELRRIGVGDRLRSWKGVTADKAPFAPSVGTPVVRVTPYPAGVDWYDPSSQSGTLVVLVELGIASLCIDDVADLWDLIVSAVSPCVAGFSRELVELGAETGEITFTNPAFAAQPAESPEGAFYAQGRFELRLIRQLM